MIPVVGVPYINRPDLLLAMIDSFDHPVERLVLVDNSPGGVVDEHEHLRWNLRGGAADGAAVQIIRTGRNLGVAASWNLVIKSTPGSPWWAFFNADVVFAPGDLERLDELMGQPFEGVGMLASFAAFGVSRRAIELAGWFDENFVPAYCEDNDFAYRCNLMGVPIEPLPAGYEHFGSAVIRSDEHYRSENDRTYPANVAYYSQKWGGIMGEERFTTPFNAGGSPADWRLDPNRLAQLDWAARKES